MPTNEPVTSSDQSGAPTDADRIRAEGIPLTLADGQQRHLRFGMLAIKRLEDHFGSPAAIQQAISFDSKVDPTLSNTIAFLRAAFPDDLAEDAQVETLLDLREVPTYQRAILGAIDEAFAPSESEGGKAPDLPSASSLGADGGSTPPLPSPAAAVSSGT